MTPFPKYGDYRDRLYPRTRRDPKGKPVWPLRLPVVPVEEPSHDN